MANGQWSSRMIALGHRWSLHLVTGTPRHFLCADESSSWVLLQECWRVWVVLEMLDNSGADQRGVRIDWADKSKPVQGMVMDKHQENSTIHKRNTGGIFCILHFLGSILMLFMERIWQGWVRQYKQAVLQLGQGAWKKLGPLCTKLLQKWPRSGSFHLDLRCPIGKQ